MQAVPAAAVFRMEHAPEGARQWLRTAVPGLPVRVTGVRTPPRLTAVLHAMAIRLPAADRLLEAIARRRTAGALRGAAPLAEVTVRLLAEAEGPQARLAAAVAAAAGAVVAVAGAVAAAVGREIFPLNPNMHVIPGGSLSWV